MDSDRIVTAACFENELEANLARIELESEGIDSFISDANIVNTYSLYSNALRGVKLNVRIGDFERASKILQQSGHLGGVEGQSLAGDDYICPECGSDDINVPGASRKWAYLTILLLGFPLLLRSSRFSCNACGNRWSR